MQVCELDTKTALLLLKKSVVRVNGLFKFTGVSLVDILEFSAVTFLIRSQLVPVFFVYAINSFVQILQLLTETSFLLRKEPVVLVECLLEMCRITVFLRGKLLSVKFVAAFEFIGKLLQLGAVSIFSGFLFVLPRLFSRDGTFTQLVNRVILFLDF